MSKKKKFSSFKEQQSLTESWRKYMNEGLTEWDKAVCVGGNGNICTREEVRPYVDDAVDLLDIIGGVDVDELEELSRLVQKMENKVVEMPLPPHLRRRQQMDPTADVGPLATRPMIDVFMEMYASDESGDDFMTDVMKDHETSWMPGSDPEGMRYWQKIIADSVRANAQAPDRRGSLEESKRLTEEDESIVGHDKSNQDRMSAEQIEAAADVIAEAHRGIVQASDADAVYAQLEKLRNKYTMDRDVDGTERMVPAVNAVLEYVEDNSMTLGMESGYGDYDTLIGEDFGKWKNKLKKIRRLLDYLENDQSYKDPGRQAKREKLASKKGKMWGLTVTDKTSNTIPQRKMVVEFPKGVRFFDESGAVIPSARLKFNPETLQKFLDNEGSRNTWAKKYGPFENENHFRATMIMRYDDDVESFEVPENEAEVAAAETGELVPEGRSRKSKRRLNEKKYYREYDFNKTKKFPGGTTRLPRRPKNAGDMMGGTTSDPDQDSFKKQQAAFIKARNDLKHGNYLDNISKRFMNLARGLNPDDEKQKIGRGRHSLDPSKVKTLSNDESKAYGLHNDFIQIKISDPLRSKYPWFVEEIADSQLRDAVTDAGGPDMFQKLRDEHLNWKADRLIAINNGKNPNNPSRPLLEEDIQNLSGLEQDVAREISKWNTFKDSPGGYTMKKIGIDKDIWVRAAKRSKTAFPPPPGSKESTKKKPDPAAAAAAAAGAGAGAGGGSASGKNRTIVMYKQMADGLRAKGYEIPQEHMDSLKVINKMLADKNLSFKNGDWKNYAGMNKVLQQAYPDISQPPPDDETQKIAKDFNMGPGQTRSPEYQAAAADIRAEKARRAALSPAERAKEDREKNRLPPRRGAGNPTPRDDVKMGPGGSLSLQETIKDMIRDQLFEKESQQPLSEERQIVNSIVKNLMKYDYFRDLAKKNR